MTKKNLNNGKSLESDVRSTFESLNEKFMSDPVYVYDEAVKLYLTGSLSKASDLLSSHSSNNIYHPIISLQGVIAYVQKDYGSAFVCFKKVVDLNPSATLDAYFVGASLFNQHDVLAFDYFKLVNENGHFNDMKRISKVPLSVYPKINRDLIDFFDYLDSLSALRIQNVSEFGKRTRMILSAKEKFPHNSAIQQIPSTLELDVPPMDVFFNPQPVRDSSKNKIIFPEVGNDDIYVNHPLPKEKSSPHSIFVEKPSSPIQVTGILNSVLEAKESSSPKKSFKIDANKLSSVLVKGGLLAIELSLFYQFVHEPFFDMATDAFSKLVSRVPYDYSQSLFVRESINKVIFMYAPLTALSSLAIQTTIASKKVRNNIFNRLAYFLPVVPAISTVAGFALGAFGVMSTDNGNPEALLGGVYAGTFLTTSFLTYLGSRDNTP